MTSPGLRSLVAAVLIGAAAAAALPARHPDAPEFPTQDPKRWIGPPQSLKALRGHVVILDVWTFG